MGGFYRGLSDQLSLWVNQVAWLHATPEVGSGNAKKRGDKSRYETLGHAAEIPENPAPHITDWLFEIGPTTSGGEAIGWRDLEAWSAITGIEFEPWEARLIKRLSVEYASMRIRGEKADCAAPYAADKPIKEQRGRVANQFKAMLAVTPRSSA